MSKTTVTIRLDDRKKKEIDAIATAADRDRSYILNEAIDSYLETLHWQARHIHVGIQQADDNEFATDKQVKTALKKWSK